MAKKCSLRSTVIPTGQFELRGFDPDIGEDMEVHVPKYRLLPKLRLTWPDPHPKPLMEAIMRIIIIHMTHITFLK